jgi:hypothetical protein
VGGKQCRLPMATPLLRREQWHTMDTSIQKML